MIILGILAYFIIGGIVLGILVNLMALINNGLDDDSAYDMENISVIGILWPISVPLLIGVAIIAIVGALINIIAGFFIQKIKNTNLYIG